MNSEFPDNYYIDVKAKIYENDDEYILENGYVFEGKNYP